jgi:hypothetical protein
MDWAEAKKRCRLNQDDIEMAKALGMKPYGLVKNIPTQQERWKAPVKIWVRELYEEKFGRRYPTEKGKGTRNQSHFPEPISDEDLPF